MLSITIPGREFWDEINEEFIYTKGATIQLEHSLVSLSKWESKYCKPFLTKNEKTYEETLDYIKFMTITQNVKNEIYENISTANYKDIRKYIEAPMSATTFSNEQKTRINREQVTSELIYYWMVTLNIPFECQKWHLNRLLTLIRVCNVKNAPPKHRNSREIMKRNSAINKQRMKKYNTRG